MGVKPCPDCSKDVSDSAMACPHCGRTTPPPTLSWTNAIFPPVFKGTRPGFIVVLVILFIVALLTPGVCDNESQPSSEYTEPPP